MTDDQLQEIHRHITARADGQDKKLDTLHLAIVGGIDPNTGDVSGGIASETKKSRHDINNLKMAYKADSEEMKEYKDRTRVLWASHKIRRRLTWAVVLAAIGSMTSAAIAWIKTGTHP